MNQVVPVQATATSRRMRQPTENRADLYAIQDCLVGIANRVQSRLKSAAAARHASFGQG